MLQKINIEFSIYSSGKTFNIYEVTEYLQINPTAVHKAGEQIVLIVNGNRKLLPSLYKETEWRYETGYISTGNIMDATKELMKVFKGKEKMIHCLCNMYSLKTQVMVVISKNGSEHYPDMRIDNEFLEFVVNTGAGMNFDILE